MADSRRNLKCSPDTFERLKGIKEETGFQWDPLLNELMDAYESGTGKSGNEEILNEIELLRDDLKTTIPTKTAREVETLLR